MLSSYEILLKILAYLALAVFLLCWLSWYLQILLHHVIRWLEIFIQQLCYFVNKTLEEINNVTHRLMYLFSSNEGFFFFIFSKGNKLDWAVYEFIQGVGILIFKTKNLQLRKRKIMLFMAGYHRRMNPFCLFFLYKQNSNQGKNTRT